MRIEPRDVLIFSQRDHPETVLTLDIADKLRPIGHRLPGNTLLSDLRTIQDPIRTGALEKMRRTAPNRAFIDWHETLLSLDPNTKMQITTALGRFVEEMKILLNTGRAEEDREPITVQTIRDSELSEMADLEYLRATRAAFLKYVFGDSTQFPQLPTGE